MMFRQAKNKMEQTKLWKIVRRMPKGALLHCHLEAMVDLDWLFREALATDGICICSHKGGLVTSEERMELGFSFQYTNQAQPYVNIWSEDYNPNTWVPITEAAHTFPVGGREGFITWLKSRCSITPEESLNHHHGVNAIWRKFISCFQGLRTLIYYEPLYRKFLRKFFLDLVDDGVHWVDIRAGFAFEYRKEGSDLPEEGYVEVVRVLGDEMEKFQGSEQGRNFWGARMIWTTIRGFDKRDIVESKYTQRPSSKIDLPRSTSWSELQKLMYGPQACINVLKLNLPTLI